MNTIRSTALLALSALLAGCSSGRTFVLDRPAAPVACSSLRIHAAPSAQRLEPRLQARFETALRRGIERELGPTRDDGPMPLHLEYRVVAHERGSAAARVVNGAIQVVGVPVSGLGDGALGVEVIYTNNAGDRLAHIVAEGPIAGVLGSSEQGLDAAAASIASFTAQNFAAGFPVAMHRAVGRGAEPFSP